jgi:hypothetical protein
MNSKYWYFAEMKLMHGDELRLRYLGELHKPWSGVGHVIKIPDSILFTLALLVFMGMAVNLCNTLSLYAERVLQSACVLLLSLTSVSRLWR